MSAAAFCIWIVTPPGYLHSRCFEEVAMALSDAFAELGHKAPIVTDPAQVVGTAIVLGPHLLGDAPPAVNARLVLYNLEQIQDGSPWMTPAYVALMKRSIVWDYSRRNIAALARLGVKAQLCGVGYAPVLTRITHAVFQDIDVAFVGSMTPRRQHVLGALQASGLKLFAGMNLYGAERDAIYGRAKVVLNIHTYDAQVFEIVRVSYLLANRICVVSETGLDRELEAPFQRGVAFAAYGELVAACRVLVRDAGRRRAIANAGFEAFAAMPQSTMLRNALAGLPAGA
jgi:hypothetical protein